MLKVYEYSGCSTCKKALAFLKKKDIAFEAIPIVDQPPTVTELKQMLAFIGGGKDGNVRKLFNTSGLLYREMKMGERLESLSEREALELLSKHGKLVKRPFALSKEGGTVGFNEATWKTLFASR